MSFLNSIFGKKQSTGSKEAHSIVQFDERGKVLSIHVPQGQWALKQSGQNRYYTQKAKNLLYATELLKKVNSIPPVTYYVVDTPDGSLGRDNQGFYTEAPLNTENLAVESRRGKPESVEFLSLKDSDNMVANPRSVAILKQQGQYARLVLLMKCGECGYESPVETQAGELVRECYCCGTTNQGSRAAVNLFLGSSMVQI